MFGRFWIRFWLITREFWKTLLKTFKKFTDDLSWRVKNLHLSEIATIFWNKDQWYYKIIIKYPPDRINLYVISIMESAASWMHLHIRSHISQVKYSFMKVLFKMVLDDLLRCGQMLWLF